MFTIPTPNVEDIQFSVKTEEGLEFSPKIQSLPDVDFLVNPYGWPLNDMTALNGCKSLQEYEVIAARLRQYEAVNPDTSKMSIEELIARVEPQTFQTPAEVQQFAKVYGSFLQRKVDNIMAVKAAAVAAKQASSSAATATNVTVTSNT